MAAASGAEAASAAAAHLAAEAVHGAAVPIRGRIETVATVQQQGRTVSATAKAASCGFRTAITADQLDPDAMAELRTLPGDLADAVARFLVATGLEEDPERAYQYAVAAAVSRPGWG